MPILDRITQALFPTTHRRAEAKAAAFESGFPAYWAEVSGLPSRLVRADYRSLAQEGYSTNFAVFAGINEVATAAKGIPWRVMRTVRGDGGSEPQDEPDYNHEFNRVLVRPNPWMGWPTLIDRITSHYLLSGNAYLYRTRPKLELHLLRPDLVTPIRDSMGRPTAYEYRSNTTKQTFPAEDVRHLMAFNPLDDTVGMSPLVAASLQIDAGNEGWRWNSGLLRNGAKPMGVLGTDGNLTEQQWEDQRKRLQKQNEGGGNAGKTLILEGGLKWQQVSMGASDLDWVQGLKLSARQVLAVLNVAPELVGDSEAKTYANYQEARKALYMETVLPFLDMLAGELNWWLSDVLGEQTWLAYDGDEIEALRPDLVAEWKRLSDAVTVGCWLTQNEAREKAGLPRYEDPLADRLLLPAGNTVLGEAETVSVQGGV